MPAQPMLFPEHPIMQRTRPKPAVSTPNPNEKIYKNARNHMDAQEAFDDFHRCNPQVYRKLRAYALEIKARGFKKYSIKTIWAVMRWHSDIETDEQQHFKLNDRYYSRYARMLMKNESELEDFFDVRELRS